MAKVEKKQKTADEIVDELQSLLGELVEIAKAAQRINELEVRLCALEQTVFGAENKT